MLFSPSRSSINDERKYQIRILGTGAANPVTEIGQRVVVTRTAVGVFKVAFTEHPGTFVRFGWAFGAATPGDVKGQSCTRGVPVTDAAGQLSISVSTWSSAFAADELLATEYLDLEFIFSASKTP
jgi:hypothetical protein